jgi:predicted RNA-binding Zn-ribbon protein involved in translation (DUF1610 family)
MQSAGRRPAETRARPEYKSRRQPGTRTLLITRALFPEVARFPSRRARWSAWKRAIGELGWRYWGSMVAIIVLDTAITFALPWLGVPLGWRAQIRAFLLVGVLIACGTIPLLFRKRIRSSLRSALAHMGVPTCVCCGYDLTANVSGRCPECGTLVPERTAPSRCANMGSENERHPA